jgi:diguanylate cyclase (GGDEF)-like protein
MFARLAEASILVDTGTLFVIATSVTSLLGVFLLFAWMQDRIPALAWWAVAYLMGGLSGLIWRLGDQISPPLPSSVPDVLLFVAVGMIWTAARLLHGRPILWGPMFVGAVVWLAACLSPAFASSISARVVASSFIIAAYTFLIAAELWRERRKSVIRRWPAIFVPMLHGAIFLFPMALGGFSAGLGDGRDLATGWAAVFAVEVMLYVVGAAFIVLILAKDRAVGHYKTAAATDPLTGLLNRRGFLEAAGAFMAGNKIGMEPVSVLAFDLDHFKSVNDEFGHNTGDTMLALFANVARTTMRANDVIGRMGGEEFVAILTGSLADAAVAAERVRAAFAAATRAPDSPQIPATVSVGVASGPPSAELEMLIARADAALYCAKAKGRNRVETADEPLAGAPEWRGDYRSSKRSTRLHSIPALAVPIVSRSAS